MRKRNGISKSFTPHRMAEKGECREDGREMTRKPAVEHPKRKTSPEQSESRSKTETGGVFNTVECEKSHSVSCTIGFIRNLKTATQFFKSN